VSETDEERQECGHKPYEVAFRWISDAGPVKQRLCGACAAMIWDRMPSPLREAFSCEEI